ncbi:MAG: hypothetical protein GF346_01905, partial [Candidatus Eisenbacteria bacterium]|nr:hypothetical protein [Candidatus Latescibacterota bacterium]MBD3301185.1 hypothetical protein [Candidatus Eisenbacteria bacterium]
MHGFHDELWILLTDFGERDEVDGAWGFGLALLASPDPPRPRVLAEPRIAGWLRGRIPEERIVPIPPGPPAERIVPI